MKKSILFLSFILALAIAGCKDEKPVDPENAPTIALTAGTATDTEFTFTIKTDRGTEFAYINVSSDDQKEYSAEEIFSNGTKDAISAEKEVTVKGLTPETSYKVVAAVKADDLYSETARLDFTTAKTGGSETQNLIELIEATQNSFKFVIHGKGMIYKFTPVEKLLLENSGMDKETYLGQFGLVSEGEQEIEWFDGGVWDDIREMDVAPDREYYVLVAESDGEVLTGDLQEIFFRTPATASSDSEIELSVSEVTSTSVKVKATPSISFSQYFVYVRDKAWTEDILNSYGESMLASLIQNPNSGSRSYNGGETEEIWNDLLPDTDYYAMAMGIDGDKQTAVFKKEFRTGSKSMEAPIIEMNVTPSSRAPHEVMILEVKSDNANVMRYAFLPTLDYNNYVSKDGQNDETLIDEIGITFDEAQLDEAVNLGGARIEIPDLWYETEYTFIVAARNPEMTTSTKKQTAATEAEPLPERVESDLFEKLTGKWTLEYDYLDYADIEQTLSAEVVIAAGADSETEDYYRDRNLLVIQGFQFQPETLPYVSPKDLKETDPYWAENPNFAMRDYGAKIFLKINADGSVCVPTAKNVLLYNWSEDGMVYFYGCDYENKYTAPVTFPVTVSADRKTITIGASEADAEFSYGTYRPAVFLDYYGQPWMRACATSDIVLKKK